MKLFFQVLAFLVFFINNAHSYDNGPKVLACYYKLGAKEGTETCLVEGSGVNQGISWIVFEIDNRKFRYYSSSPNVLEQLSEEGKLIKSHLIVNSIGQCRPGGRDADVYKFSNGDRICLYW